MGRNCAVIDLGTNTFHLLVAEIEQGGFRILYKERIFVKLGENGVATLGKVPFERGVLAMKQFAEIIEKFKVEEVRAIGTAALRTASNGADFLSRVQEVTGITIQTIQGDREAELIQKGVSLAVPIHANEQILVMDIGGGSVEFIIADEKEVFWTKSFPIGVAVLFKDYHNTDPISTKEKADLISYLNETLQPLDEALKQYKINRFVGASGTFDVLENNLEKLLEQDYHSILSLEAYRKFQDKVLKSTHSERLNMPEIPRQRADLLVVALILVQVVLEKLKVENITVSRFAMKEGILKEIVEARQN